VEVLSPDGVVQRLGFSFDLFQKLEQREGQVGELTVGRGVKFDEPVKQARALKPSKLQRAMTPSNVPRADKRWVIGTDDRTEVTNTWVYPYSAVGQVGTGCTGWGTPYNLIVLNL